MMGAGAGSPRRNRRERRPRGLEGAVSGTIVVISTPSGACVVGMVFTTVGAGSVFAGMAMMVSGRVGLLMGDRAGTDIGIGIGIGILSLTTFEGAGTGGAFGGAIGASGIGTTFDG